MQTLAVYGILKNGYQGEAYMGRDKVFLGRGKTEQTFWLPAGGWGPPCAVKTDKGLPLVVEVFQVSDETLEGPLDMIENNGRVYIREVMPINMDDGTVQQAWLYVHNTQFDQWRREEETLPEEGYFEWQPKAA